MSSAEKDELARLMLETPELKELLDTKTAFATSDGIWLENVRVKGKTPQPIVVLLNSEAPRNRTGSITQSTNDGTVVGGFTFQANENS
jgi:hypothetical protein